MLGKRKASNRAAGRIEVSEDDLQTFISEVLGPCSEPASGGETAYDIECVGRGVRANRDTARGVVAASCERAKRAATAGTTSGSSDALPLLTLGMIIAKAYAREFGDESCAELVEETAAAHGLPIPRLKTDRT